MSLEDDEDFAFKCMPLKKIGEVLVCLGIKIVVFAVRHMASREDRFCWGHVSASNQLNFPYHSIRRITGWTVHERT